MTALRILGVPSSAGAYCVGVERAPTALREAGLIDAIVAGGVDVEDQGDLTMRAWTPDRRSPFAQNIDEELASLRELVDAASEPLRAGDRLLVLGGSCTLALGVCAALGQAFDGEARMLYVDRHPDLNTPSSTREGSLSWMGMAHALALPSAIPELSEIGRGAPVLLPSGLSYLGVELAATTAWERDQLESSGISLVSQGSLVASPAAAARKALAALHSGPFATHLDVDVLDFLDAPLAENVDGRNSGPTIDELGLALAEAWRLPDCRVLSVSQLDPNHAASSPDDLTRFVDMLAGVLTGR